MQHKGIDLQATHRETGVTCLAMDQGWSRDDAGNRITAMQSVRMRESKGKRGSTVVKKDHRMPCAQSGVNLSRCSQMLQTLAPDVPQGPECGRETLLFVDSAHTHCIC